MRPICEKTKNVDALRAGRGSAPGHVVTNERARGITAGRGLSRAGRFVDFAARGVRPSIQRPNPSPLHREFDHTT